MLTYLVNCINKIDMIFMEMTRSGLGPFIRFYRCGTFNTAVEEKKSEHSTLFITHIHTLTYIYTIFKASIIMESMVSMNVDFDVC